jgi:hypothetical protein
MALLIGAPMSLLPSPSFSLQGRLFAGSNVLGMTRLRELKFVNMLFNLLHVPVAFSALVALALFFSERSWVCECLLPLLRSRGRLLTYLLAIILYCCFCATSSILYASCTTILSGILVSYYSVFHNPASLYLQAAYNPLCLTAAVLQTTP